MSRSGWIQTVVEGTPVKVIGVVKRSHKVYGFYTDELEKCKNKDYSFM